jgi:hypothetical protein
MGPVLIFDKSTIQSLSAREAKWLTHSYISNITPVLFIEIMADLKKAPKDLRTPEQLVSSIATKFSPINSGVNIDHISLYATELLTGESPPMNGQVIVGRGREVIDETGKRGVFLDTPPEQEALHRWQKGQFAELEHVVAQRWRGALRDFDLAGEVDQWQKAVAPKFGAITDLSEFFGRLEVICAGTNNRFATLKSALGSLGIEEGLKRLVIKRWKALNGPPLEKFAPYAAWCFRVNILAGIAMRYNLVGKPLEKKNIVDMQYLYYLPFCDVFTSHDVFHKTLAPIVKKPWQTFVPGEELKTDLAKIAAHWDSMSDEIKATGSMNYAAYPPRNPELLTYRLWDKHVGEGWKQGCSTLDSGKAR